MYIQKPHNTVTQYNTLEPVREIFKEFKILFTTIIVDAFITMNPGST